MKPEKTIDPAALAYRTPLAAGFFYDLQRMFFCGMMLSEPSTRIFQWVQLLSQNTQASVGQAQ